jgi:uncharacterized phage protein (TIGR02216 family)
LSGAGDELSRAAFPWDEVMQFGLSRLRLAPEQFWRLTLRELFWLAGGAYKADTLPRPIFNALMQRFPD